uniref:Uncharacterized protein n=1 Tax=Arundo donax TaxID=35708 RepID=A0A0A9BSB4_ARUDO
MPEALTTCIGDVVMRAKIIRG